MTYQEALQIPVLQIYPSGLMEDCFYLRLAETGQLTEEEVKDIQSRVDQRKQEDKNYYDACWAIAGVMLDNLRKYGHPCIEWWPKD